MEENENTEDVNTELQSTEEHSEKPEKKKATLRKMVVHLSILLGAGLIITLGFFYIYLPKKTNHNETITVPDLLERSMDDLETELVSRGLRYEVNDSVYTSKYPPLTIVQQYPSAGSKVKEGRKIFLSVNRNTVPMVSFPDNLFAGEKSLTHVKAVLNNLDVEVERTLVRRGKHFNLVLEVRYMGEPLQNGDKIPKGSSVVVIVSDGYGQDQDFEMPNFFGSMFDEADVRRKGLDLNLEPLRIRNRLDTTDQVLFIIRQSPDPETEVRMGENITFWVDTELDSTYYFELFPDTTSHILSVIDTVQVASDTLNN